MKILQLCKKIPFPLKDGESIAVTSLATSFRATGAEMHLLAMNTSKHHVDLHGVDDKLSHYTSVHEVFVDNEVKPLHAFFNLFSSDSYNIARFENPDFDEKLVLLLQTHDFDIVQLESLYLAPYIETIRKHSNALVVLRAHNVEHEIWKRLAKNSDQVLKRWYLDHCARKLKKYEIEQLQKIDILLPISTRDAKIFKRLGFKKRMHYVPIGLDTEGYAFNQVNNAEPLSISFIGSLDWMPNIEGLNWFLTEAWPMIHTSFPNITLHIAGRNCPDWLKQIPMPNVVVHGEVEDAKAFLLKHPLTVVPLLSGSGMRVKILEAMALGRVVISTTMGMEGIKVKDKQHALLADSSEAFLNKIRFCIQRRKHLTSISTQARQLIETKFSHCKIAEGVIQLYEERVI